MSVQDMTKLVAQALKDDQFRETLLKAPDEAVKAAGLELTEEEMEAIRSVDLGLSQEELEERVSKMWGAPSPASIGGTQDLMNSSSLKTVSAFR